MKLERERDLDFETDFDIDFETDLLFDTVLADRLWEAEFVRREIVAEWPEMFDRDFDRGVALFLC